MSELNHKGTKLLASIAVLAILVASNSSSTLFGAETGARPRSSK